MPILDPDPTPAEPQTASIALCDDRDTAEQVRAQYDAEQGLPIHCRCADSTEPSCMRWSSNRSGTGASLIRCQERRCRLRWPPSAVAGHVRKSMN